VTSIAGSFAMPLPGELALTTRDKAPEQYMTGCGTEEAARGVIVALVEPIFVASKSTSPIEGRRAGRQKSATRQVNRRHDRGTGI